MADAEKKAQANGQWRFEMVCSSHAGCASERNDDNFSFFGVTLPMEHRAFTGEYAKQGECRLTPLVGIFGGMGEGPRAGLASYMAAEVFAELALKGIGSGWDEEGLADVLHQLNTVVMRISGSGQPGGTGSTALLLAPANAQFKIAGLGNSPAFLVRDGQIRELTAGASNQAQPETTDSYPQHLGLSEEDYELNPCIVCEQAKDGDVVVLCTDGVTETLAPDQILAAVGDGFDLSQSRAELESRLVEQGAKDSFTMLLCRLTEVLPA